MRGGAIVASFPVEGDDQIMLATSTRAVDPRAGRGHLLPVALGRRGARCSTPASDEVVVSVARIAEQADAEALPDDTQD